MPHAEKMTPMIWAFALEGAKQRKEALENELLQVNKFLNGTADEAPKRHLSAGARKRIRQAQKRRWRKYRKENGKK